jgi:hypothetical protein
MEAAPLLESLQAALGPEIHALGGSLGIQSHEAEAVTYLMTGTHRWRVVLICDAEEVVPEDGLQQAGVVNYTIRALVQHAEGPLYEKGQSTFKQGASPHAVPLLQRCTQLRLLMLRCQFLRGTPPTPAPDVDHETGWYYLGRKVYAPTAELLALRTYELIFRLRAGLLTPDYGGAEPLLPCLLSA